MLLSMHTSMRRAKTEHDLISRSLSISSSLSTGSTASLLALPTRRLSSDISLYGNFKVDHVTSAGDRMATMDDFSDNIKDPHVELKLCTCDRCQNKETVRHCAAVVPSLTMTTAATISSAQLAVKENKRTPIAAGPHRFCAPISASSAANLNLIRHGTNYYQKMRTDGSKTERGFRSIVDSKVISKEFTCNSAEVRVQRLDDAERKLNLWYLNLPPPVTPLPVNNIWAWRETLNYKNPREYAISTVVQTPKSKKKYTPIVLVKK